MPFASQLRSSLRSHQPVLKFVGFVVVGTVLVVSYVLLMSEIVDKKKSLVRDILELRASDVIKEPKDVTGMIESQGFGTYQIAELVLLNTKQTRINGIVCAAKPDGDAEVFVYIRRTERPPYVEPFLPESDEQETVTASYCEDIVSWGRYERL